MRHAFFVLAASFALAISGVGAAAALADPDPDCALLCGKTPSSDDLSFIGQCSNTMVFGGHHTEEECEPYKAAMSKYCARMHAHMDLCDWAKS
ncbi:MAG: hypothetical protein ACRC20_10085 [Segniliparus sp.]|uniref:hypothetical protein n=1 Tax=Segniliparus sp. TaxID=2804064 RepID=UPI003F35D052